MLATLLTLGLLAGVLTGCGTSEEADGQTLTVFAASSLTGVFEDLEEQFEAEHPGVDVRLSFGGSADLVAQLREGARADVFASADAESMDDLVAAGLTAGDPREIATNTLVIAVPPGNPAGIEDLTDLDADDLALVLCAPEVPCGRAAARVAAAADVDLSPLSEEQSVSDVLAKVRTGEADAGLVYVTDVAAGDSVRGIAFDESDAAVNHYEIAIVAGSEQADLAADWADLVLGAGRRTLTDAGFGAPAE
ncbi:molybdate ABC transporter substrate-binding protein [Nocardioides sp. zg-ZUI104]|nr:molybdate ABC transporter substrate-binding protein [Nocardioides faecalis]